MNVFDRIKHVVADILDMDEGEIFSESYLVRDLGAESIDLLELAVSLNAAFQINITDDDIFLRKLRIYLEEARTSGQDPVACLAGKYPFLSRSRIREMLEELSGGPVLKVRDLVSYVSHHHEAKAD